MRIGIVGSGNMGTAFARLFARAGHEVAIGNSRGPTSLRDLVAELGPSVRAATVPEAVAFGEVVLVAIPYRANAEVLGAAGPYDGKLVVDVTNYSAPRDGRDLDPAPEASSVAFARLVPGARAVVKAFNTIWSEHLLHDGRPEGPDRRAILVAADDVEAKALVADLVRQIGFAPVDTGSLADSTRQQPGTPVYNAQMTADEARERLAIAG